MTFWTEPYKRIYRYRRILLRTSLVELRSTYAGSVLGLVWVALGPLLLLAMYAILFLVVLRVRPSGMSPGAYLTYILAGLVPFTAFSTALNFGALSLAKSPDVLLNTVFPAELLPVRASIVASAVLPPGLLAVVLVSVVTGSAGWWLLLVPVVIVLQVLFTCGVTWLLSLITLALRDVQYALQYVTMMLMFISPIAYTPDMAPRLVKVLMYANPLFYFLQSYQSLIVMNRMPAPEVALPAVALAVLSFSVGHWAFERGKQAFLDYA